MRLKERMKRMVRKGHIPLPVPSMSWTQEQWDHYIFLKMGPGFQFDCVSDRGIEVKRITAKKVDYNSKVDRLVQAKAILDDNDRETPQTLGVSIAKN